MQVGYHISLWGLSPCVIKQARPQDVICAPAAIDCGGQTDA